jgi:predicted DNA-binding transcriptional regulator AlpA
MSMSGERLLTIAEVMEKLGVRGRSTFLEIERREAGFPRRVWLSPAKPRFRQSEVDAYIASLPHAA